MTDVLVRMMAERKAEEQQALVNEITRQREERAAKQADEQIAASKADTALRQRDFDYTRSKDIVESAGGDEQVDDQTADLLSRSGFGGRVQKAVKLGTPGIGVLAPEELPADAQVASDPYNQLKPGPRYEQARAAAAEKAALAEQNAAAKAEADAQRAADRAAEAENNRQNRLAQERMGNQTALTIAGITQAGRAQTAADKKTAEEAESANKRRAVVSMANDAMKALDRMQVADKQTGERGLSPEMQTLVGGIFEGAIPGQRWLPGSSAANAQAKLNELKGKQVVDLIAEMKAQSRTGATGFGALSEKELGLLESAAARLDTWQDQDQFNAALEDLREKLGRVLQEPDLSQAPGAGIKVAGAGSETPRRRYNPATRSFDGGTPSGPRRRRFVNGKLE